MLIFAESSKSREVWTGVTLFMRTSYLVEIFITFLEIRNCICYRMAVTAVLDFLQTRIINPGSLLLCLSRVVDTDTAAQQISRKCDHSNEIFD